jgi:glycosyltransferase involved in cell wall biosynthesis
MKFSVLLPTRNGREYLRYAIQSVLQQDYDDWELVVSDNCSDEDVEGYLRQLGEERIRYFRTAEPVSVTDNWNNCIEKANGEYLVMLGDDDALLLGYFREVARVVGEYDRPDLLFTDAYLYAYPNVHPRYPRGYLQTSTVTHFAQTEPFMLGSSDRQEIVRKTASFRYCIPFNMQYSLLSRQLVGQMSKGGPFFESVFPDYYATTAAFLKASRIVVWRKPLVVIGVTRKSHGYFSLNQKQKEAVALLNERSLDDALKPVEDVLLPGDWIQVGWLSAMHRLRERYRDELRQIGAQVDFGRHRRLQIDYHFRRRFLLRETSRKEFDEFIRGLPQEERPKAGALVAAAYGLLYYLRKLRRWRLGMTVLRKLRGTPPIDDTSRFASILEVVERFPAASATGRAR